MGSHGPEDLKIEGEQNRLGRGKKKESGPKAASGYTRQLNTQQNFKTSKTNWSLFFFKASL